MALSNSGLSYEDSRKNIAPPPQNGSAYVENRPSGSRGRRRSSRRYFPPAHFTTGHGSTCNSLSRPAVARNEQGTRIGPGVAFGGKERGQPRGGEGKRGVDAIDGAQALGGRRSRPARDAARRPGVGERDLDLEIRRGERLGSERHDAIGKQGGHGVAQRARLTNDGPPFERRLD